MSVVWVFKKLSGRGLVKIIRIKICLIFCAIIQYILSTNDETIKKY